MAWPAKVDCGAKLMEYSYVLNAARCALVARGMDTFGIGGTARRRRQGRACQSTAPCLNVRYWRRSQWVDATPAANLSSGDLTPKSFWVVCLTGRPLCSDAFADTSTGLVPLRKALSEQALCILIGTAPSAYLQPQASVSRRTLGYVFEP